MLTIVTIVVIIIMLLIAYRSFTRAIIPLVGVLITLATARGVVSLLVENHIIGISSFAMNMAVSLVLGVATDYGIFYLGRFQEALRSGRTVSRRTTPRCAASRTSSSDRVWRSRVRACA